MIATQFNQVNVMILDRRWNRLKEQPYIEQINRPKISSFYSI